MAGLRARAFASIVITIACAGCSRTDRQLEQHSEAFTSLSASTAAITDAWLRGLVSGTYALTALDQTFLMVEQERTSLTASASMVIDDRGAAMSDAAEQLSRDVAELIAAVRAADAAAARRHVESLPFRQAS